MTNVSTLPVVREATRVELWAVRRLWTRLYAHQKKHGLVSRLAADGFEHWCQSLEPILGRFACLFVVDSDTGLVGFLAGRIKLLTPPFDPTPTGFVSEVFVDKKWRGLGLGHELLRAANNWFAEQGISRMELQVLAKNVLARRVYKRLGWREDVVQMVRRVEVRKSPVDAGHSPRQGSNGSRSRRRVNSDVYQPLSLRACLASDGLPGNPETAAQDRQGW